MSITPPETDQHDREYRAAISRCTEILDAAAQKEQVPSDKFRAAINEAIAHTQTNRYGKELSAEAFLLSLVAELF